MREQMDRLPHSNPVGCQPGSLAESLALAFGGAGIPAFSGGNLSWVMSLE